MPRKKCLKIACLILVNFVLLSFLIDARSAAIISTDQKKLHDKNINYFDLDCSDVSSPASDEETETVQHPNVYVLGDSITVRAKNTFESEFRKKGAKTITVNGSENRSITQAGNTPGFTSSGLEALSNNENKVRTADIVVIELGTNQRDQNFKEAIGELIENVKDYTKNNKNAKIFWVNVFSKGGSDGYGSIDRERINKDIEQQSQSLNFSVIDTVGANIPTDDSVHQTIPEGNNKLTEVIAGSLFDGTPDGQTPPPTEKKGPCACSSSGGSGTSGTLSPNVPEPWRSLINDATQNKEVAEAKSDPNIVATTLWVENRGWPDYNQEWAVSDSAAQGPWQFIPSTWTNLGRDGDGDGVKDPNNPKDAVISAFLHSPGSLGKPIANTGYDPGKNADQNWETVVFERNQNNLLSFVASYNGNDGTATEGGKIKDFPRGQNGDYTQMGYWLLASDFVFGWDPLAQKKIDAKSAGESSVSGGPNGATGCSTGTGAATGEFIWPLEKQYPVTSCYGYARGRLHTGIDIGAPAGTQIVAADGGTVEFVGVYGGFGNTVIIKHDNDYYTLYAHQKTGSFVVQKGDKVDQGQKIGEVNNTGSSFGDHLHFNIQTSADTPGEGNTKDPLKYLPNDGRGISGGDCPASLDQVER